MEFAFIAPVLFLLLFGTITGGLTFSRQNSVENAVREATRFGAILPDFEDAGNLNELYRQVRSAATGDLDADVPDRSICVALIDDDDTWDYEIYTDSDNVDSSDSDVASPPAACAKASDDLTVGAGTRRIWVRASRTSDIEAVFYQQTITLDSRSMTRYER